jgi:acyl dehydratase
MEEWGLDGPYFDDLQPRRQLEPAPALTIDSGACALYQGICGDPLAVALSAPLAEQVTGTAGPVVNPALVLHVSIGQSTVATRRGIANLFYRGVGLRRAVRLGETLTTRVEVRGQRETTRRPDRPRRGIVLLGIRTHSDRGDLIADYERAALLPFRDPDAPSAPADDLGPATGPLDLAAWDRFVPAEWDLAPLGEPDPWPVGHRRADPLRDTVTHATALVRLTQNLAGLHRDPTLGQAGRRLVYGGHTIGLAQAALARLLPSAATVLGWHSCDHVGPVFEDDLLATTAVLDATRAGPRGRLLAFTVLVTAMRDGLDTPAPVLDWKPVLYAP